MPPEDDLRWMARALAEAGRGRGSVEPNPMVGAVVVRDGTLVGVGHHELFGGPHAEVNALARAGGLAAGSTLYVTLEPCCHQGKTPPCTEAVIGAGMARVVAALRDPFPKVDGGGAARLRAAGVEVSMGLMAEEAARLNGPYLKRLATGLPYVLAKWAMTLDGKTASRSGDSRWISGPRSRALVHEVRGRMDAILVGIGTVMADDPSLTARPTGPRTPARVVLDGSARLPVGWPARPVRPGSSRLGRRDRSGPSGTSSRARSRRVARSCRSRAMGRCRLSAVAGGTRAPGDDQPAGRRGREGPGSVPRRRDGR